ncbi:MAG: hypothetical protein M3083_16415 [Actinomycetota bacterium]|nr:hypothetical protein [Actinomycetota bacterium]
MSPAFASVLAAVISGAFAVASLILNRRAARRDRALSADNLANRYRSPLLHAAFDLQARLYNIQRKAFLDRFYRDDAPANYREYAAANTMYLIGQYLCYSEVIRRSVLLLDPVDRRRQQALMEAMARIRYTFATDAISDSTLVVFRGEQRAIGEILLAAANGPADGSPRWDCWGYAEFVSRLDAPEIGKWFGNLRVGIDALATDLNAHNERLIALQHDLLGLIALIDPDGEQVPSTLRKPL